MKIDFKKTTKIFYNFCLNFIKNYYPFIIIVLFFIFKSLIFNTWAGLGFNYPKTRAISALGMILILSLPVFLLKKKNGYFYFIFLSFFTSLIFISQLIYNQYVGGFLSFSALGYSQQLLSVTDITIMLLTKLGWKVLIIFADFIILILLKIFFYKKIKKEIIPYKLKLLIFMMVAALGIFSYLFIFIFREKTFRHVLVPINPVYEIQRSGIVTYFIEDSIRYVLKKKNLTEEEETFIKNWQQQREITESLNYHGIAKDKNIIIIQTESFQNFLIDLKINGQEITPNLNKLSKESLRFSNFYFQVGPGNTSDAEFTTYTSLYPLADLSVNFDYPTNNYPSLAKILNQQNYKTIAMHGNQKHFWNRETMYKNLGIAKFYDLSFYQIKDHIGWGLADEDFFDQSLEYLKQEKQPFLSTLITLSSHTPYDMPNKHRGIILPEDQWDNIIKMYFYVANYTDRAIGKFIEKLKEEGLYDNSIVIIFGDHNFGLENFTNDKFEKLIGADDKDINPYNKLIYQRVPLFISVPGSNLTGITDQPASVTDLAPTLLNLLGKPIPKQMLGNDIFNNQNPLAILRRNSVLEGSFINNKYLFLNADNLNFDDGTCYNWKENKVVENKICQKDYQKAANLLKVNDLLIRGNGFDLLNN